VSADHQLKQAVAAVAAEGTDPDALSAVLGWLVRPQRSAEGLRRRCLEDPHDAPPPERLRRAAGRVDATLGGALLPVVRAWHDRDVRVAVLGDPGYPRRLAAGWPDLEAPPLLAWRGRPVDDRPTVAIVGARRATGYGTGVAAWLAEEVARAGVRVVSGGALGIDAAAHRAAVEEPGGTAVVLGCGHAVDYPRPHATRGRLFDQVVEAGGTIASELLPWQPPRPGSVRARNRIVAALADVVVVVEGGEHSGALLTASAAADRGVPVLAVPGDVRAPGSAASHKLLAEGAGPCTSPGDVLDVLPMSVATVPADATAVATAGATGDRTSHGPSAGTAEVAAPIGPLPPVVHLALVRAWPRPLRVDELAAASGCPPAQLLAALTRARVAGVIAEGVDGVRLRRSPVAGRPATPDDGVDVAGPPDPAPTPGT
jgi:DNA processing protein